ncbi:hypothetical protein H311_04436 [Anncaliia algerae PRA109]|uniref:60S ribosomal protein L36 n=2 Tax=Opisthokonta TaxID=33154 RepID=A0A059F5K2_9MICR|nr:hypothetical protein H311_04436 [Anncaliia algerae PRA109]KCZ82274.1 hypothetical protein H312_00297 [Anncaliia algerae PRA339]
MLRKKLKSLRVKYKVTPLTGVEQLPRPNQKKRVITDELKNVRAIVSEICGLAPYEKKAVDLIKRDQERKCRRFLKKRLGSLKRSRSKFDQLAELAKE